MCSPARTFEGSWYTDPMQGTAAQDGSTTAVQCGLGFESLTAACGWSVACGHGDLTGIGVGCVCCGFVTF